MVVVGDIVANIVSDKVGNTAEDIVGDTIKDTLGIEDTLGEVLTEEI